MTPQEWRTFVYESPEQDSVVLLFDMLYEFKRVFTRQYWMGATPYRPLISLRLRIFTPLLL